MKSINEHMWLAHPSSGGCTKYALEGAYSVWYSGTNIPSSIVHPSTLVSLTKHVVTLLFSLFVLYPYTSRCIVTQHVRVLDVHQSFGPKPKSLLFSIFGLKGCRLTLHCRCMMHAEHHSSIQQAVLITSTCSSRILTFQDDKRLDRSWIRNNFKPPQRTNIRPSTELVPSGSIPSFSLTRTAEPSASYKKKMLIEIGAPTVMVRQLSAERMRGFLVAGPEGEG
jgi:hypothetical protein